MKHETTIVSKLIAAIGAALLLAPLLAGAPPQRLRNPKAPMTKPQTQTELDQLAAAQKNYEFYTIDEEGALGTFLYGLNNSRMAVVISWDAVPNYYTTLWWDGRQTPVVYPGSTQTLMGDVNDRRLLFGNIGTADVWHGAVLQLATGTWTLLPDITGKTYNTGYHMNNVGIGVGDACDENFENCLGWTWNGKAYSFTTIPGTSHSWEGPFGINDQGEEVGTFEDASGTHAYLLTRLRLTTIDMPGVNFTSGEDINNQGEILLLGVLPDNSTRIGIWKNGVFTPLPGVPNAPLNSTTAYSLNDRGDYCGYWIDAAGVYHGFVAFRK